MNTFRKAILIALLTLGFGGTANATPSLVAALPDLVVLTTELGGWIADEAQALARVLASVAKVGRVEVKALITTFDALDANSHRVSDQD